MLLWVDKWPIQFNPVEKNEKSVLILNQKWQNLIASNLASSMLADAAGSSSSLIMFFWRKKFKNSSTLPPVSLQGIASCSSSSPGNKIHPFSVRQHRRNISTIIITMMMMADRPTTDATLTHSLRLAKNLVRQQKAQSNARKSSFLHSDAKWNHSASKTTIFDRKFRRFSNFLAEKAWAINTRPNNVSAAFLSLWMSWVAVGCNKMPPFQIIWSHWWHCMHLFESARWLLLLRRARHLIPNTLLTRIIKE